MPEGILEAAPQIPLERRMAVTRADRRYALNGRATGPSRALIHAFIAGMALLVIALAGSGSRSSVPQLQRPADLVVGAHVSNADIAGLVATRVTGHPPQTPTWSGSGVDSDFAQLLTAALLASLLLSLVRLTRPPSQSAQSLPRWRGPPQIAFVNRIS
jgi:hypothetical protein